MCATMCMEVYEEMLEEFLNIKLSTTNNENKIYGYLKLTTEEMEIENQIEYANPTTYEYYERGSPFKKKRPYYQYKRTSFFREYLNRVMYCQFVNLPKDYEDCVKEFILAKLRDPQYNRYNMVLDTRQFMSKKKGKSKYMEHCYYLVAKYSKLKTAIKYQEYNTLVEIFRQLEIEFMKEKTHQRKNLLPYALILQTLLYLLHIHPPYYMHTTKNTKKKTQDYESIFIMLKKTPLFQKSLKEKFLKDKIVCQACNNDKIMFDIELINMFKNNAM